MHLEELIHIIKERRRILDITQDDLSELSGIGLRTVKAIESGKSNPTFDTINKLISVLGLDLKLEVKKPEIR